MFFIPIPHVVFVTTRDPHCAAHGCPGRSVFRRLWCPGRWRGDSDKSSPLFSTATTNLCQDGKRTQVWKHICAKTVLCRQRVLRRYSVAQKASRYQISLTRVWHRWRFMTDSEITNFLKANGSSTNGLFTTHNHRGKPQRNYRAECGLNGARLRVGYIRLWTSAFVAQQQDGFTWDDYVADVLGLPPHQMEGWPQLIRRLYEKLEGLDLRSILSSSKKKWSDGFWQTTKDVLGQPDLFTAASKEPEETQGEDNVDITNDADFDPITEIEAVEAEQDRAPGVSTPDAEGEVVIPVKNNEKNTRHPVLRFFLDDIPLGLGMLKSEVAKRYENNTAIHEITLDQKLRLIKNKITHKLTTHRCYIRTANLFLLWLNEEDPSLWKESGILLATQHNIYSFLEDYRTGKIRPTGGEPSICQVLKGVATFKRRTSNVPLSSCNGAKLVSSLSFMYDAQQTLLNAVRVESLRSYRTFNLWENNLQYAETDRRHGTFNDRQKNVLATECPLSAKKRQSVHWILEDSWLSIRNRAFSLCQAFSVSRFDELSKWSIADMHAFNYSSSLPTVGEQDINVIYVQQSIHKNLKDGRTPDEKLIIRHKDLLLCPLSSVAMMMFERFVFASERPVDLTNFQSWYNVKVFRNLKDPDQAVKSSTLYSQRKEMMANTATATSGCVNHYDRKLGALIARLHGVGNSELKSLGLWDTAILDRHYTKYALPDTVAKLSGFGGGQQYYIPRANADPMEFQEINGGEAMFSCFFPFLDDSSVFQSVLEQRAQGNNTCFNVYQTLHLIRLIFWQDLPHYFALYPQLRVFKCAALTDNWGVFLKWCDFCNERVTCTEIIMPPSVSPKIPTGAVCAVEEEEWTSWTEKVNSSIRELKSVTAANAAKLDRLLHALECHGAFGKRKREEETDLKKTFTNTGRHILRKLRELNDMTIEDVYEEWNVSVTSEGIEFGSLKEFERRRTELKEQYRSEGLKTAITRRRHLACFVEQTAAELGSLNRAFKWIEDLQVKLGQGKKCTLYRLWQHINAF